MPWEVTFHPRFLPEYEVLADAVQNELLAHVRVLAEFGPGLGRPRVDMLKGSRIPNLKELRFSSEGGVCVLHSPSIGSGSPYFWWPETSEASHRRDSTGN